jgi:hypothetical protein
MKKDTIVQFVCFATNLNFEKFVEKWETYARPLLAGGESVLNEASSANGRVKYRYISMHECNSTDFKFAFMKGRDREHFPEHNAKVVHAGGYMLSQKSRTYNSLKEEVKVIAFLDHRDTHLDFYNSIECHHLNVYTAYYESCLYSHILEFFIQEKDVPSLLDQLKTRSGVEAALCMEREVFCT